MADNSQKITIVGIYNGTKLLFENAKITSARFRENARMMEHPIESGSIITDHKILMPIEISFQVIISSSDYRSVYASIKKAYANSSFLIVQTRSGAYKNMVLQAIPHEENASVYNALIMMINLKEVFIVGSKGISNPKSATNGDTKKSGTQQGKEEKASVSAKVSNYFRGK